MIALRVAPMTDSSKSPKTEMYWAGYVPSDRLPWNLRRVVHLHRRGGFAATAQTKDLGDVQLKRGGE